MKYLALFLASIGSCVAAGPVLLMNPDQASASFAVDQPKPPFRFEKEEMGGTASKVIVKDSSDRRWIVKFGPEGQPETFASRIVNAVGFYSEPAYYLSDGSIEGATNLGRASAHLKDGKFTGARFEYMNPDAKYSDRRWTLTESSLEGTQELGALKALIALLSNWDVKADNMRVVEIGGNQVFGVTDWGRTMGRAEDMTGRSQWDCATYTKDSDRFVQEVVNGNVLFNYAGKQRHEVQRGVKVEHARWLAARLQSVSDDQVAQWLRDAGASAEEVSCFVPAFRKRVQQLASASAGSSSDTTRTRKVTTTVTTTQEQN